MKCPNCKEGIHSAFSEASVFSYGKDQWTTRYMVCPECHKAIIRVIQHTPSTGAINVFPAFPPTDYSRQAAPEVTDPYSQDFNEASAILTLSPKGSAAISRRTLQAVLRDKATTKAKDLYDQIEEVIGAGNYRLTLQTVYMLFAT
jgi:hypothetical protein